MGSSVRRRLACIRSSSETKCLELAWRTDLTSLIAVHASTELLAEQAFPIAARAEPIPDRAFFGRIGRQAPPCRTAELACPFYGRASHAFDRDLSTRALEATAPGTTSRLFQTERSFTIRIACQGGPCGYSALNVSGQDGSYNDSAVDVSGQTFRRQTARIHRISRLLRHLRSSARGRRLCRAVLFWSPNA
jgi:hypothetical protein